MSPVHTVFNSDIQKNFTCISGECWKSATSLLEEVQPKELWEATSVKLKKVTGLGKKFPCEKEPHLDESHPKLPKALDTLELI